MKGKKNPYQMPGLDGLDDCWMNTNMAHCGSKKKVKHTMPKTKLTGNISPLMPGLDTSWASPAVGSIGKMGKSKSNAPQIDAGASLKGMQDSVKGIQFMVNSFRGKSKKPAGRPGQPKAMSKHEAMLASLTKPERQAYQRQQKVKTLQRNIKADQRSHEYEALERKYRAEQKAQNMAHKLERKASGNCSFWDKIKRKC